MKMPMTMSNGYDLQDLSDLRDTVNQWFINKFGQGIDLSDDQTPGLLAGILAQNDQFLDQMGNGIYNSFFVLKSSGTNLDDLGAEEGIFRKPASEATTELTIKGYLQAVIPEGSQFSTTDGQIFNTDADVSIDAQDGDLVDDNGEPLGQVTVAAHSDNVGAAQNAMPNTIVNSEEVIDGFYSVTNPNAATGGSDIEDDSSLQQRILLNRKSANNSSVAGVESSVLDVPGVRSVKLVNNNTMATDQYDNPAKSIHLYVIGGEDADIAQAYFNAITPQANTQGDVQATAYDIGKVPYGIKFSRAKTLPVYVNVTVKVDNTVFDQDNGPSIIKQDIINYFDGLSMGDTVLYTKLIGPAYAPNGVNDVELTIGTDPKKMAAADVKSSIFQLPMTDVDHITVTVD